MKDPVVSHYTKPDLTESVFTALRREGKDPERLQAQDLEPVDQFHIGGKAESEALLRKADLPKGGRVLDVGCGLGGAARTLALAGFQVQAIDLTPEFVRLAAELSRRCGVNGVRFCVADARALPFRGGSFDGVWLQHVNMNVAEKEQLFLEIARVLRPGGRLAFHEVCAGSQSDADQRGFGLAYPTPWASGPETSFLTTSEGLLQAIQGAGLSVERWSDRTNTAISWFRGIFERAERESPQPSLGLHLLLGPGARAISQNMLRNLTESRVSVVMGVAKRRKEPG